MSIFVRAVKSNELDWANQQYHSIDFVPTDSCDRQFIAEIESQRVGLGRLVHITDQIWELGGIYVLPEWRGRSVAREIVKYLLQQAGNVHLYCLPFTNLGRFYQEMGFVNCFNSSRIPEKIKQKYQWCQKTYSQGVLLLEIPQSFNNIALK